MEDPVARILLVDDVRRCLDLLKNYLKRTTCRILTARSGTEALALCRREAPDLIFLDAGLPGSDGLETCRLLKADPDLRPIPVVIVTGPEGREECVAAGCDDVLPRPVTQGSFLERVRRFAPLRERQEDRITVSLRVEFRVVSATYTAFTKDLSPHGAFLKSPRPFAVGTPLTLTIHLPRRKEPLRVGGEVRRVVEEAPGSHLLPGIGVAFRNLSPEATRILKEFIKERRGR
ncbi:MAG TPA: response regulator [Candidatus Polarisedimenticolia bacterium]|nr:response regulator [Candidatus Polarisedimenticolia bacterium]